MVGGSWGKQGNSGLGFGKSDKFFKRATPRFVKLWECVGQGRNKRFAGPGVEPEPQPRLLIGACFDMAHVTRNELIGPSRWTGLKLRLRCLAAMME
jgi:hypothetical protein